MKKIIPALICILLVGALALSASAADSSVSITPSDTTLERGDTFTVVANLNNSDPIKLCTVVLSYDESVFELIGGECNVQGTSLGTVLPDRKTGTLLLMSPTVVSGNVFTFWFKVKSDAEFGSYTITPTASIGTETGSQITASPTTVVVSCSHSYSNWEKVDDNKHRRVCSKCNTTETEAHDWNDGAVIIAPGCTTSGKAEVTCLLCRGTAIENIDATGHAWDNACDTTCNNNCGETRVVSHSYSSTWSSDETGHWYACAVCGNKENFAEHIPGAEATDTTAQTCTVCSFVIEPAKTHEHTMSEEWITDSEYHWHRCTQRNPSCYYVENKEKHVYDDCCDMDCNTCGYIRVAPHDFKPDWLANAEGHWHVCLNCNAQSEMENHVPGPEATETEPQRCEECNIILKMELSHVHDFGEIWYGDDANHWQSCTNETCFETTTMEPHSWDEGVEQTNGDMLYTCSVCAKQLILSDSEVTGPTTVPSQGSTDPTTVNGQDNGSSGGFPWQWAGVAAIVLLVAGIVLLVIEFIRSRKYNSHGKYSK